MNYHDITVDDMNNGDGLRVVLWVSGCDHKCFNCQNPQTWDPNSGIPFTVEAEQELYQKLKPDYISGLTLSGGDPLNRHNYYTVLKVAQDVKKYMPDKTIWLYTGSTWEQVSNLLIMKYIDVLVDGEYIEGLADEGYHWAGSINQRVIDVQASLESGEVIIHE